MSDPIFISEVSKSFLNKRALENVSFSVKQNEVFGFIGLNGVGKTTLIKIMLDLLDPDSGNVFIFGENSVNPTARKKICYLPERFYPSRHLTGLEFLAFSASFYNKKISKSEAQEMSERLDLDPQALQKRVSKYSKGMTQKLGLISAFLSGAELLILDEPMSGLDVKSRIKLKNEIIEAKSQGKTVFFSSHILSDIDEICDSISVLNNSKIVYTGTPLSFKTKHDSQNLESAFLREIEKI